MLVHWHREQATCTSRLLAGSPVDERADFDMTAGGRSVASTSLATLWWLVLFGVPLSWRKSRGGLRYTWIGLEKGLIYWPLGVSEARAAWMEVRFQRTLAARTMDAAELWEALGRLVFVYGALQYDGLFQAPLFSFLALHKPGREQRLPVYVLIVLRWLRDRIRARRARPVHRRATVKNAVLRADAKAGGLAVAVGGWLPFYGDKGCIVVGKSRWFSVRLTTTSAPWAFVRGSPARAISTLELLATTLGLVLLSPPELHARGAAGAVAVTGLADSQVSSAVVLRGLTTAFPFCALAMKLSAQLEARGADTFLDWIPRGANREVDALADGLGDRLGPALRVCTDLRDVRWLALGDLLDAGSRFFRDAASSSGST